MGFGAVSTQSATIIEVIGADGGLSDSYVKVQSNVLYQHHNTGTETETVLYWNYSNTDLAYPACKQTTQNEYRFHAEAARGMMNHGAIHLIAFFDSCHIFFFLLLTVATTHLAKTMTLPFVMNRLLASRIRYH